MSTPKEPDLARGWLFAEKLLGERHELLDKIDKLTDEEFEELMRKEGIEVSHVPTFEELMALAAERRRARGGAGASGESNQKQTPEETPDPIEPSDDDGEAMTSRTRTSKV